MSINAADHKGHAKFWFTRPRVFRLLFNIDVMRENACTTGCTRKIGSVSTATVNAIGLLLLLNTLSCLSVELAADVTLTSDYVWRGITQNRGKAALQAGLEIYPTEQITVGLWGSTVDFTDASNEPDDGANIELNAYAGYEIQLSESLDASLQWVRYVYPGTHAGINYNYSEVAVGLDYKGFFGVNVAHSSNVMATGHRGLNGEIWAEMQIPADCLFNATYGFSNLDQAYDRNYRYYQFTVSRSFSSFTYALQLTGTDHNGTLLWGSQVTGSRALLMLSKSF